MPTTTRTIRVFISSTFSDLKAERNALQERVFPHLKRYCQRHGWVFQAIDLRWGVLKDEGRRMNYEGQGREQVEHLGLNSSMDLMEG